MASFLLLPRKAQRAKKKKGLRTKRKGKKTKEDEKKGGETKEDEKKGVERETKGGGRRERQRRTAPSSFFSPPSFIWILSSKQAARVSFFLFFPQFPLIPFSFSPSCFCWLRSAFLQTMGSRTTCPPQPQSPCVPGGRGAGARAPQPQQKKKKEREKKKS